MSTLTKPKSAPRKKPVARTVPRTFRLGYAAGKINVAPGVDLTKPTLPPGKYL